MVQSFRVYAMRSGGVYRVIDELISCSIKFTEATVRGCHPDRTSAVLCNSRYISSRRTILRETFNALSIEPVQPTFRTDPDVAFGILEYARYAVIRKTISSGNVLELEMIITSVGHRLR